MRHCVCLCASLLIVCVPLFAETTEVTDAKVSVYFSPGDPCTGAIVKALDGAKSDVRILAYVFSAKRIMDAVVEAQKRGVCVEIILDKKQRTSPWHAADFFAKADIPTRLDTGHQIAHNKVMIIDDNIVITGSFNFTASAETKNAENLLVIESKALAASYLANYEKLRKKSEVYISRKEPLKQDEKIDTPVLVPAPVLEALPAK